MELVFATSVSGNKTQATCNADKRYGVGFWNSDYYKIRDLNRIKSDELIVQIKIRGELKRRNVHCPGLGGNR